MEKLKIGTIVNYCFGKNDCKYEILRNEITDNKVEELYFGRDGNGNVLHTATGLFDYVLAEYNENGDFVRNITCKEDDIEKKA